MLERFDVTCLENSRKQHDIMFVSKLYHRKIDSSELLTCFPLYVTPIARKLTESSRGLMYISFARVDTIKRGLFVRAPVHVNDFLFNCNNADMFHD